MASKKYLLLAALIVFLQTSGIAQSNWGWDWKDSSKVPTKSLPQYNEFLNNQFPYPPKPRSQWEIGVNGGYAFLMNTAVRQRGGYSAGITFRKAIDHNWSFRFGITSGVTYGQGIKAIQGPGFGYYYSYGTGVNYVPNYRASIGTASFDFIYSINPQSYYRGNPKWNLYVLAGYSMVGSETQMDSRNATGGLYNYASVNFNAPTKDIVSAVQALRDGKYDSPGYNPDGKRGSLFTAGSRIVRHGLDFGGGFSYKINSKYNVGVEQKFTTLDKYVDGSGLSTQRGILSYLSAHININL